MNKFKILMCTNLKCENYQVTITIRPNERSYDPYLEWPKISCICGSEPKTIETENGLIGPGYW